jgi:alginate O-acetyltransferase complex protein AlgJ
MTHQLRKIYVATFGGLLLALGGWSLKSLAEFHAPPNSTLLDGKLAKTFESHYDEQFPVKRLGTNLWAAVDYLLFGSGRPGVVIGQDNWLYTDEEFHPVANAERNIDDNLALIAGVRDALARQDVQLLLAIVPAKARVYPEYLGEERPVALHRQLYQDFHARARQAGIEAPDLLTPLRQAKATGPVFLRTDTHWTPSGAALVAERLASHLAPSTALPGGTQRYLTEVGDSRPHKGDLLNFLPLDPLFAELLPPPDPLPRHQTRTLEEPSAGGDDALFADTRVPVALVGTSYSANSKWNFAGALRQALGSDLLNFAEDGQGPLLPMLKFLQSDEFREAPPQWVIWEFPERYLPLPNDLSEFDPSWIAQLKSAGAPRQHLADESLARPGALRASAR